MELSAPFSIPDMQIGDLQSGVSVRHLTLPEFFVKRLDINTIKFYNSN